MLDFKTALIIALLVVLGFLVFSDLRASMVLAVASMLGGTIVGFVLAVSRAWYERVSRVAAYKKALEAEVQMCVKRAGTYLSPASGQPAVKSPAYRCPTDSFVAAFPWLLQDGALPADAVISIEEFYAEVADFNRCLDYCHAARYYRHPGESDDTRLNKEYDRAKKKATNVLEKQDAILPVVR